MITSYKVQSTITASYLLLGLAGMFLLSGCGNQQEAQAKNNLFRSDTVKVEIAEVQERDFSRSFRATGTLEAKKRATISTVVGGPVAHTPVDIGDHVQKGDTLLQIREIDYKLTVERAKSDLAQADAQFDQAARERERAEELYKNGTASEQDLDQAVTAFNKAKAARLQAEATLNTALQNLDDASIQAPFDGVITERKFEPGEFAPQGEAAIEILNLELLEADLEIPEKYLGLIKKGSGVQVEFEANFIPRLGTIVAIIPKVSSATRTFRIRVQVKNDSLLSLPSGQFISTEIALQNITNQLAIPQEALDHRDGASYVWIYENGKAKRTLIEEGLVENGWVMVRSGVKPGDLVITEGKNVLTNNYPVRVAPKQNI